MSSEGIGKLLQVADSAESLFPAINTLDALSVPEKQVELVVAANSPLPVLEVGVPAETTLADPALPCPSQPGPRLASKSAVILPKQNTNASELERRKNEIVTEMLARLQPFVNAQGVLKVDADFDAYAELMAGETHFVQRTLLLTVLLGAGGARKEQIFQLICASMKLLTVLSNWLGECAKTETPMLGKLLDLILGLPLTVDQLVSLKLGKPIKKLAAASRNVEIRNKAESIVTAWTRLARTEDAKRKTSMDTPMMALNEKGPLVLKERGSVALKDKGPLAVKEKDGIGSKDKGPIRRYSETPKSASEPVGPIANLSLFSETPKPSSPPLKTRAAQILERVARGETSKVVNRPLSADDIHREKKRQQYLAAAASQGASTVNNNSNNNNSNNSSNSININIGTINSTSISDSDSNGTSNSTDSKEKNSRTEIADDKVILIPKESLVQLAAVVEPDHSRGLVEGSLKRAADADHGKEKPEAKRAKKRVSFASESELVQTHYYEADEEEHGRTEKYHRSTQDLDRNEASYAFRQMALAMEADCAWKQPSSLNIVADPRGMASIERQIQEDRERTVLSAVYFSVDDIPPCPSEALLGREEEDQQPRRIPLRDVEGRVSMVLRTAAPLPTASQSSKVPTPTPPPPPSPSDLLSFLSNPTALQDILKTVAPPPTASLARPPYPAQSLPAMPPGSFPPMPPGSFPPGAFLPGSFPPGVFPPGSLPPGAFPPGSFPPMPPGMPPPPFAFGMSLPSQMGMYPPPFPFPPPPHPHFHAPSQQGSGQRPVAHQKRHPCKFYRAGRPNSCKFGTSCQFLHADH